MKTEPDKENNECAIITKYELALLYKNQHELISLVINRLMWGQESVPKKKLANYQEYLVCAIKKLDQNVS